MVTENEIVQKMLNCIQNDDIRKQTKAVLERVNDAWLNDAASSTGKYHPSYALGDGGLLRHTFAALMIYESLISLNTVNNYDADICDYMRAAIILHDSCKRGKEFEQKYTAFDHPLLAGELIRDVHGDNDYAMHVCPLVESHMGEFNKSKWSKCELPLPSSDAAMLVFICDYLASRKFLEVNFDDFNISL